MHRQPATITQASFYGEGDGLAGKRTASGEKLDPSKMTAAHKTYPFGTQLRVTSKKTGKSAVVRINDRGPYAKGRGLDLSPKAAHQIGMTKRGVDAVSVELIPTPSPTTTN